MKRILSSFLLFIPTLLFSQPCSTTNATGCDCPDGSAVCELQPDITISWYALENYDNGPTEYSQTGNGQENGRLRLTGSTPNIGWGPLTVRGVDANGYRSFVCGTDTFSINDPGSNVEFTCPNGNPEPKQIIYQRVYQKNNGAMTYYEHESGTMTYHPTHGHNHVDDWAVFTLRVQNPNEPDTLKWPIIGTGAKIGFCLMDYGSCDNYVGHCRDNQTYSGGTVLTSGNFPNYGLGGGQYNCSPIEQGISVGYTDIYSENLDGMWIDIPPSVCNGDYWIVMEVDPNDNFIEMNDGNNWAAIPFELTKQLPVGSAVAEITLDKSPFVCSGSSVTLEANIATSYLWSTGDTTASISINTPGDYFVETSSLCGQAVSDTLTIAEINSAITLTEEDTTCVGGIATLVAEGTGEVTWFDAATGGNFLQSGTSFAIPDLQTAQTFYAENYSEIPGTVAHSQPTNHSGVSNFSATQFSSYLIFNCFTAFTLKSVKVYTDLAGVRLIEWRSSNGTVLADTSVYISAGTSRINLDFNIVPGTNYQLGTNASMNNSSFGYNSPALKRTSSGVNYPFNITDVLSIYNSDNGTTFYYYFYDWEIEYGAASCVSARTPVQAVASPAPAVSITGLDTSYQISAGIITMDGQPAGGSFSGDGVSGNTFDPAQAGLGIHSVTYSYTDTLGCSGSASIDVYVRIGQIIANAGGDTEICIGENTTLTATGGTQFNWNTGEQTASITVSPVVTTTYTVTVSDDFGSSDVAIAAVTVNSLPVVNILGLAAEYFQNENAVTLTGSPAGGTFAGDGISGNDFDPAQAGIGLHDITYSYADANSCAAVDSEQVLVKQSQVTASTGDDEAICLNENVTLTASGGTQYEWNTGEQSAAITVNPAQTTTYSVTVSDNFGSSDAADVTVTVNPLPIVDFTGLAAEYFVNDAATTLVGSPAGGTFSGLGVSENTFTPANAGIGGPYPIIYSYADANSCVNTEEKTVLVKEITSAHSLLTGNIRVYPNPAQHWVMLDFSGLKGKDVVVKMWNSIGKELIVFPLSLIENNVQSKLDLATIPTGIYFLEVVTSEGTFIQKVVRE